MSDEGLGHSEDGQVPTRRTSRYRQASSRTNDPGESTGAVRSVDRSARHRDSSTDHHGGKRRSGPVSKFGFGCGKFVVSCVAVLAISIL